jgi:hypothetical protein
MLKLFSQFYLKEFEADYLQVLCVIHTRKSTNQPIAPFPTLQHPQMITIPPL